IITDAQGRSIAQSMEILNDQDFSGYPALPPEDVPLQKPSYQLVSRPAGIRLGDIPIVKNALSSGRPLAGLELLNAASLQRLGLDKQANIGIRTQKIEGLPKLKQPFPEGTYNVDQGKAGLVLMAVNPVKVNGKRVGTAMVGTLLNRNYLLVDKVKKDAGVATATLFAKDWRVSTNVPYTDKSTRAIGTRASREVAEAVLNQGKVFLGEANIVGTDYITGYGPLFDHQKQLDPSQAKPVGIAYVGEPKAQLQQILTNLRATGYGIGGAMLLMAGLIALPIANSFSRPLRRLAGFAQQVGAGEQGLSLEATDRRDEIGVLSQEMNQMAASIEANIQVQRQQAQRAKQLSDITLQLRQSLELEAILNEAVSSIRAVLQVDRVVVFRLNAETWEGNVFTESVGAGWPQSKGVRINDPCLKQGQAEAYQKGRVRVIDDIYQDSNLTGCYIEQLEQFQVKANLVAPILTNNQLFGLLIAHQCSGPRSWQQAEVDLFTQLASQVGIALEQANLLEQVEKSRQAAEVLAQDQRRQKEAIQMQLISLLSDVEGASQGDLTVRADVTAGDIGTVADFFNSIIENLRQIVTQVKAAAVQVNDSVGQNEGAVSQLAEVALKQAEEITRTLNSVEQMSQSIQDVADSARQAAEVTRTASTTAETGGAAMDRTVASIISLRNTVADTAQKVKRLGESSRQISKVVALINQIALQTNLLAINASIEAARAGEEGRGFAVVAEEVGALAVQSAEATKEIEQIVEAIQRETNQVVEAMELGTTQVVEGAHLVEDTKQSLGQIVEVSHQIDALVASISKATVSQAQTSQAVTYLMQEIAKVSERTSDSSRQVSSSLQQTVEVAQQLQASVGTFKVGAES
ncbi:MAG TPA: methyl-accepting chemotaxis protein, partial [Candidatus Caenarcaniphilales bacterium]